MNIVTALHKSAKQAGPALLLASFFVFLSFLGPVSPADAASPWWNINTSLRPSTVKPGGEATIIAKALNLGDACTTSEPGEDGKLCTKDDLGAPLTLAVSIPAGTEVVKKEAVPQVSLFSFHESSKTDFGPTTFIGKILHLCNVTSSQVTCSSNPEPPFNEAFHLSPLAPYEYLEMRVRIRDLGAGPGSQYSARASGGGTAPVSRSRPLPIGETPPSFGTEDLSFVPEEEGGAIAAHAGSHPFQLTASFNLNQSPEAGTIAGPFVVAPAMPNNLHFKLPPGQLGNVTALPTCSLLDFAAEVIGGNKCPANTVLGVAAITLYEPVNLGLQTLPVPVFNLEPKYGEPARFGFVVEHNLVVQDTSLRSGSPGHPGDYGINVDVANITQLVNFISSTLTFWGVPGDPRHNQSRGWECLASRFWAEAYGPCEPSTQAKPHAFLTLPTNCAAPLAFGVEGESWPNPAVPAGLQMAPFDVANPIGLVGCNQLPFAPQIKAEPTSNAATSPSGLDFNLNFDDEGLTNAEGLAQSQLNKTVVTLPEGFTINPSAGVGLGGCTLADYGRETMDSAAGAGCPNNSKLGTVEVTTPLLATPIHGSLFIAQPHENQFGSLVALYFVLKNPETGVLIKLAGKVTPDPVTGQLTTTFENNPQLPFDHFNFHFREGQQAPLITPATCGTYTTTAQLTPWSNPAAALTDTSSFTITKGFDGGACPSGGVPPFHPGIVSGMQNNNAGRFSPFYLHLTRTDGEQEISGFSTNLPSGLTGNLTGIPFCAEAQIAAARTKTGREEEANPSCPAQSQVGHTLVGTGVGAVLAYVPGKIYLAGPFHGAPFSLVAVTSAVVGPFDLGTVVLHFGLNIDPYTAQVSVSPTTSEPIPTIIDGIVTHVRDIRVYIDRQNFILNPTSCTPFAIGSTLNSPTGASATITSPFQAASCANLKFAPKFAVSTSGKTSRTNGASLHVKLTYPQAPAGTYANIAKVKVDLPKQLPSRLTTLQKACTAAQFNTNPSGCPAASFIGHAKAVTPLIPVPLEGPAIFVSHGGEAFPSLVLVLQGYGVTIDLVGSTFISKAGVTSSTFRTVPDQPIGSFELTLPQGPFSALGANANLCKVKGGLKMPTTFVAQNGLVIHRSTPVGVTGCPKHRAKKAKKAHRGHRHKK